MTLAMNNSDGMILLTMLLTTMVTLLACVLFRLIFTRIGLIISGAAICTGLAYFGWGPFFGGQHAPSAFFGATLLFIGLLGSCVFAAIEEFWRRLAAVPERQSGFPVIQSSFVSERS